MRGSVRKRGTTWTWYLFELAPVTGKRQQRSKGGFRTKRECQEALNEALARLREGTFVPPSQRTLGSFLPDEWLPAVRPPSVRPSTWLSYRMNAETHIVPALGHLPLQRLTPAQLTAFYRSLLDHGRRDSGGLAPKTVRNIHGELHTALKDAMRWGYVARNIAASADLPRAWRPRCTSGAPSSSGSSSTTHARIGFTPLGCCSPPLACGAGRSPASDGPTWPWRPAASPRAGPASS